MTHRQLHVYEVLNCFLDMRHYPPSLRELTDACGLKSVGSMHGYVSKLRGEGLVTWARRRERTLHPVENLTRFLVFRDVIPGVQRR